jgi:hypothetical protein
MVIANAQLVLAGILWLLAPVSIHINRKKIISIIIETLQTIFSFFIEVLKI